MLGANGLACCQVFDSQQSEYVHENSLGEDAIPEIVVSPA
jgi:hypothetical protein